MKKKKTPTNIRLAKKRQDMMEAGAYDGRFKNRVVKDKKKYTRKNKHKNK